MCRQRLQHYNYRCAPCDADSALAEFVVKPLFCCAALQSRAKLNGLESSFDKRPILGSTFWPWAPEAQVNTSILSDSCGFVTGAGVSTIHRFTKLGLKLFGAAIKRTLRFKIRNRLAVNTCNFSIVQYFNSLFHLPARITFRQVFTHHMQNRSAPSRLSNVILVSPRLARQQTGLPTLIVARSGVLLLETESQ